MKKHYCPECKKKTVVFFKEMGLFMCLNCNKKVDKENIK